MTVGSSEIIFLFFLALLLFGPKKLPEIGRNLGKAMRELRKMSSEITSQFEDAIKEESSRHSSSASTQKSHTGTTEEYNPYADLAAENRQRRYNESSEWELDEDLESVNPTVVSGSSGPDSEPERTDT